MNQIVSAISRFHETNGRVSSVAPVGHVNPKAILLTGDNGEETECPVDYETHEAFMSDWKKAGVWFRIQWASLD